MPSGRRNLRELSSTLRFRLTVWNTAVVLSMILFTLGGVREGLRLTIRHETDALLVEEINEVKLTIEQLYPDRDRIFAELERKATSHTHRGLYIRLFDEAEQPLWNSAGSPPLKYPTTLFTRQLEPLDVDDYRLVHVTVKKPGVPYWTIRIGTSFKAVENDVAQLTRLMLLVGVIALIVAPLGGYWLAGRATRPIAQIIDTTARLHPSSLDERLPLRATDDELDRLSATINGFLDRIAAYLAQMREFTANAAHELRSPLAAIQSSLEVTLNADRPVDEYKEQLLGVLEQCDNLSVLVNQLLLLAESDAGLLQFGDQPVRLDELTRKACDMFQGVAETGDIRFRIIRLEAALVQGDALRLRQVINNLLDNAIKFTPPGGEVQVEVRRNAAVNEAVLRVRDTGIGIPAEDVPRIFERFFRGDKARGREETSRGSGLGLAICQSIVAAHHGRIDVHSMVGSGTTFTIALPLVSATAASTVSGPRIAGRSEESPPESSPRQHDLPVRTEPARVDTAPS